MSIFLAVPTHNPKGPDGQGWNRMALGNLAGDQCVFRPKTLSKFLYESLHTIRGSYGNHNSCINQGKCQNCKIFKNVDSEEFPWAGEKILIRVEQFDGDPFVMNKIKCGWGEYCMPTTWERLIRLKSVIFTRFKDEHSVGVLIEKITLDKHMKERKIWANIKAHQTA